jgi:hypothetical protein
MTLCRIIRIKGEYPDTVLAKTGKLIGICSLSYLKLPSKALNER